MFRPCQYFTRVSIENGDDTVTAIATGYLSLANTITPEKTDIPFTHTVTVAGNTITIKTECEGTFETARTYYGVSDESVVIKPFGYDEIISSTPESDTDGINQSIIGFRYCTAKNTKNLGCTITLPL